MSATAEATTTVAAPAGEVWKALTEPDLVAQYMFGSRVESDWQPGSPIAWKGEYEGKPYEDHGEIVEVVPDQVLEVTHFSPLSGQPDEPENYHHVRYELQETDGTTTVRLTQDNAGSDEEAEHSAQNWQMMLDGLKKVVEGG